MSPVLLLEQWSSSWEQQRHYKVSTSLEQVAFQDLQRTEIILESFPTVLTATSAMPGLG